MLPPDGTDKSTQKLSKGTIRVSRGQYQSIYTQQSWNREWERGGKENGHKQMLGQAAAMLVSLPALLTAKFRAVDLSASFLGRHRLAVTGPPVSALVGPAAAAVVSFVSGHVNLVVDCAVLHVDSPVGCYKLVCW